MRDAQSALDQVIAFAGQTMTAEDVSTVLGLVGRDLLIDLIEAVVEEDGPRAFALADRAVEAGHDLRLVCRELSRVVRDTMLLSIDPSRAGDGELAEGERERLTALAKRFSREDLMRAFDLLSNGEQEIRTASHPRYYFEMLLLRWMHLRKLVPLTELMEQLGSGAIGVKGAIGAKGASGAIGASGAKSAVARGAIAPAPAVAKPSAPLAPVAPLAPSKSQVAPVSPSPKSAIASNLKDSLLAEIRAGKPFFYNTVIAQAQKIEVAGDRVTFTFSPTHRALREQFEQSRGWVETTAERVAGRRVLVESAQGVASAAAPAESGSKSDADGTPRRDLKADAMSSSAIQAVLEVFPAEIRDVEEIKPCTTPAGCSRRRGCRIA
jgi:DNA polymerase-3 subunit gamma/tau